MKRIKLGLLVAVAAAAVAVPVALAAIPTLKATLLQNFTISLKTSAGKPVKLLKAGKYTFVVADKASIHNFTVKGPGIANRTITGTSFVGTKTAILTLKPGTYVFYCTVHPTLRGTFKVSA